MDRDSRKLNCNALAEEELGKVSGGVGEEYDPKWNPSDYAPEIACCDDCYLEFGTHCGTTCPSCGSTRVRFLRR